MSHTTFRSRLVLISLLAIVLIAGLVQLSGLFSSTRFLKKLRHGGETFFTVNPDFARSRTNSAGLPAIPPVWVAAKKPEGVRRAVILGDSVAAGFPLTNYHLGRLVEARWRARFPDQSVEVIDLSMADADTRTLNGFAREAMALEPDAIVLYAGEGGQDSGVESDVRDIVRRALQRDAKVLFVWPAFNHQAEPTAETNLRTLWQKVASASGPAVGFIDADRWLRSASPASPTDREFFLDDKHLAFAGRVAAAELIVDGLAALWGLAPRDDSPAAVDAWWKNFPQAEGEARRDTLFNPYDEHDMWSLLMKQESNPARRAALGEKVRDLQRRAALGWDTTDVIVTYERAQLQNPRDPLTHFTAGRLLGLRGEGVRAEEAFARGFALQPNHRGALLDHAAMQTKRGDTESARASIDALQKFDPQAEGLLKMQAAVALREAELPEAAELLQKHLTRNPADAESWLTLSEIQLKLGDFAGSEASQQKARAAAAQ